MTNGVIETVGELVKQLKKCTPSDKIIVSDGWNLFVNKLESNTIIIEVVKCK